VVIHYNLDNFNASNAVFTIGSFDGVHLGHQKVIAEIIKYAHQINGESVLLVFWPHPREILSPLGKNIRLLQTIDERISALEQTGIDHLIVFPFTLEFSKLNACSFIENIVYQKIKAKHFFIGFNQRFGSDRIWSPDILQECAGVWNIRIHQLSELLHQSVNISSTQIRDHLFKGEVRLASQLLGYKYNIKGKVVKGRQLGRKLGFPTANISLNDSVKIIPADGVYVIEGKVAQKYHQGMMNIGIRPTINGVDKTLEAHFFDFDGDIYDKNIEICFVDRLRNEMKFNNLKELQDQLHKDKEKARQKFNKNYQILISPDSYKGTLNSLDAAQIIEQALKKSLNNRVRTVIAPLADGGEGSIDILKHHLPDLHKIHVKVRDALMHEISTYYFADLISDTAFIEIAKVIGLNKLSPLEQNPLFTSSYGVGQLITDALKKMFGTIVLFTGGSSTNDAALGILKALGAEISGEFEGEIPTGFELEKVRKISNIPSLKARLIIAGDVDNPFTGPEGAVRTYAFQKGATEKSDLEVLENGMQNIQNIIYKQFGIDLNKVKGAGAAGGIAGTMHAVFKSEIINGADFIFKLTQFDKKFENIDLIITGEGSIDWQTMNAKLISRLKTLIQNSNIPIWAIAGHCLDTKKMKILLDLNHVSTLSNNELEKQKAMMRPDKLLFEHVSTEIFRLIHQITI